MNLSTFGVGVPIGDLLGFLSMNEPVSLLVYFCERGRTLMMSCNMSVDNYEHGYIIATFKCSAK